MTQLDTHQKRTFIALACKLAWADGVVADAERAYVAGLVSKLGGDAVSPAELDLWLATGAPPAELAELPEALGQMFVYDALALVESDGEIADEEHAMLEKLLRRVSERHALGTRIARIALARRPGG